MKRFRAEVFFLFECFVILEKLVIFCEKVKKEVGSVVPLLDSELKFW